MPPQSIDHSSWSRTSCTDDFRPNPSLTAATPQTVAAWTFTNRPFGVARVHRAVKPCRWERPAPLPKPRHGLPSDGFFERVPQFSVRFHSDHQCTVRKTHCVIQTQFMSRTVSFWREFPKAVLAAYLWPEGLVAFLACLLLTSNWIQTATLGGRASETL